jgi:nuclear cap-binding protein subunit 1
VTASSLLELYKSLLSVLTELGGGGDRAERVIRAVGEGLLRVGPAILSVVCANVVRVVRICKHNTQRRSKASLAVSKLLFSAAEVEKHSTTH